MRKKAAGTWERAYKRRRREQRIQRAKEAAGAAWKTLGRWIRGSYCNPVLLAMPLAAIMVISLMIDIAHLQGKLRRQQEESIETATQTIQQIRQQAENPEKQEKTQEEIYGCESLTGSYGDPWDSMSQDWAAEDIEGFYYHDISEICRQNGGELPPPFQVYIYTVCQNYNVDFEMVCAMIEVKSKCVWNAKGKEGEVGLMQIAARWHGERMERLGRDNLEDPYTNIIVGVDYLAEIKERLQGTVSEADLPYYMLACYDFGYAGSEKMRESGEVHYKSNEEIMQRAEQMKEEKEGGKAK